ncbi:SIS domain-containing protein [Aestuariivirga litoralis]|uniref:SIS domain-containing protein n=1 Tax=Aestuariivirga litoralis TaxID=2650924 RepID=UPI0018C852A4|nr:SIS domain-containing protein [Aestuariivirga litoralis]MBG1233871.1 SIS domain-containing protein [Aestuariivirga litoralis]
MSLMKKEAQEAPQVVARFLAQNRGALSELGARLRTHPPSVILTAARGSSDHAATYFKYLVEILLGVPCASVGASVASVWHSKLKLNNAVCVTISQSGQSPDILALQEAARKAGALTIALVNQPDSPAQKGADFFLPLSAGPEKSVAATKSFIASLVAGAAIAGHWADDKALLDALENLPARLEEAAKIQWPSFVTGAAKAQSLYVLGRGPGLAIANECALKMKETCGLHAEALSFAEVMHGPLELVRPGFPVLAFSPNDASRSAAHDVLARIRSIGAEVHAVEDGGMEFVGAGHAMLDPISMVQSAYLNVEALAQKLGRNPDHPKQLSKVTETV